MTKTLRLTAKDLKNAAKLENFRVLSDYSLEKRCGTKLLHTFAGKIRGGCSANIGGTESIFVVAGSTLYRISPALISDASAENAVTSLGTIAGTFDASHGEYVDLYMFAGSLFILGGGELSKYDGTSVSKVAGYVPLIRRRGSNTRPGALYERRNLLTKQVRVTLNTVNTSSVFWLGKGIESVDKVLIDGVTITGWTWSATTYNTSLTFDRTFANNDEEPLEVWYTLKDDCRSRVTSCRHSAVYGGDTDSRVFLYGGNERSVIFPSEPSGAIEGQVISGEYFPEGADITVADGNPAVSGAVRQFDRLAIFTEDGAFYTYPHDDGLVNEIPRFSFPILPLNSDVGATKAGGAVLLENEPYALDPTGLYKFKSTSVRDERLAVRVEAPDHVGLTSDFIANCILFTDKLRGELWCCHGGKIVIYNARLDCWYRFTGIDADGVFSAGADCFFKGTKLYAFDDNLRTDLGTAYSALCESMPLDFGDPFERKTLCEVGISVSREGGAKTGLSVTSDTGGKVSFDFTVPEETAANGETPKTLSPRIFTAHARLGRFRHIKVSVTSPAVDEPLTVREVMLSCQEG